MNYLVIILIILIIVIVYTNRESFGFIIKTEKPRIDIYRDSLDSFILKYSPKKISILHVPDNQGPRPTQAQRPVEAQRPTQAPRPVEVQRPVKAPRVVKIQTPTQVPRPVEVQRATQTPRSVEVQRATQPPRVVKAPRIVEPLRQVKNQTRIANKVQTSVNTCPTVGEKKAIDYSIAKWTGEYYTRCSMYNTYTHAKCEQDCPDSSFTFYKDLSTVTGNPCDAHPGCIQLAPAGNYCYAKPTETGTQYIPWIPKLSITST